MDASRKRINLVKTYLSDSELAHLNKLLQETGLKKSDIIRSLITRKKIEAKIDHKILMDLNRLGGLFKHALVTLKQSDSVRNYTFLRKATDEFLKLIKDIHNDLKNDSKK